MAYYTLNSMGEFLLCIDNERHSWFRRGYSYVGIKKTDKIYNNNDYVSYRCEESEFDGKIGFMISNNNGFIRYFPNKE